MRITDCLLAVAAALCEVLGQQSGSPESAPSEDAVDLRQDGGYGFRYRARDQGGHYGEAVAIPDNTVNGRFGYREPGTGRVLETQYTAGERGFRARGPTVHRRMDLSQVKIPYNPPVSPDSPDYNPTYSTYYDPNEDSSYHFDFATNEYKRTETGGPLGQIGGAYSYVDDVGDIHNVEFEAGSQTGFHVKTPFPDSNHNYNELYFRGDGKVPLRGRTSIQRGLDGSYRFTTHSQDQRRSEVKDAQGNTRGSYTYIDKDGVQRTVQYIAGPNIGYKIVNQGLGPNLDPQFPYINQNYIPPILQGGDKPSYGSGGATTSPLFNVDGGGSGSGVGLGDIGGNDGFGIGAGTGAGKPPKGPKPPRPTSPPFGFDSTSPPTVGSTSSSDKFGQSGSSFGEGGSSFGDGGSSFGGGGSSFGDVGSSLGGGESAFGSSGGGGRPSGGGGRPSGGGGRPSGGGGRPFGGGESTFGGNGNSQRPDGNTPRPPSSCCPIIGNDKGQGIGFSSEKEGSGVGSGSQTGEPPYPPSGLKPTNGLPEPNFTPNKHKPSSTDQGTPSKRPTPVNDFLSPTSGYPPYHAGFPEEETPKPFEKPSFKPFTVEDNLFLQRPFSSLPPAGSSSRFHPDRTDDFHNFNSFTTRPEYIDDILEKDGAFSEDEFTGFPPGISVKGRIQSLDINPFGTKVPAPGDALEQFNNEPISAN